MLRRTISLLLVAVLTLSGAVPAFAAGVSALTPSAAPVPLPTTYTPPSVELAGTDRVATAARIAQEGWEISEYVVIATSTNFPDALAGAPLAHALGAPLLLTPPAALAPAVASEIVRLGATRAVVLGGVGALSEGVIAGLVSAGIPRANIERIFGDDRYETARDIAARLRQAAGPAAGVVLASGLAYPDALAAAGYAARTNSPILLTRPAALDAATREAVDAAGDIDTLIVGGTGAVSEAVASEIGEHVRIFGADRYETASAIAEYAFSAGVMTYDEVLVATGETFPDALAAGPYAAKTQATLVLTRTLSLPVASGEFVASHTSATKQIVFLGGTGAVATPVRSAILAAATTQMAEEIYVVDDTTDAGLLSASEDELVFSASTPLLDSLAGGEILLAEPSADTPEGYLRRVVGVSQQDGAVVVEVTGVPIEQLVEDGSMNLSQQLSASDIAEAEALTPGATLVTPIAGAATLGLTPSSVTLNQLTIEMDEIPVGDARLNGSVTLTPGYDFDIDVKNWDLKSARFVSKLDQTAQVTLSGPPLAKEIELYKFKSTPVKTMIGPVPVWVSATIVLFAGVDASGSVDLSVGVEQSLTVESGLEYESGDWSSISNIKPDFGIIKPTASNDIVVEVYAGAKMTLKLYDLAGPYGEVKPLVETTFTIGGDPWWRAVRAIDLTAAFIAEVDVGIGKFAWTWTIAEIKKTWRVGEALIGQSSTPYVPPPDTTAPSATADVRSVYYGGASIPIAATDPSPGSGVKSISYTIDGGSTVTVEGSSASVDVSTLGTHTLRYWATDNAGNSGTPLSASFQVAAASTGVVFADADLEASVRQCLGIPSGEVTTDDMLWLISLDAIPGSAIQDLSGLEYAHNLTTINLPFNQISDLSPLANLTKLTSVYLAGNRISDLSPLATLSSLTSLDLFNNQISNLLPLATLTKVTNLGLDHNRISDVSPLANMTALTDLGLSYNQISDLTPLANLIALTNLDLQDNLVSDLSPLANMTALTYLYVQDNLVSNLSPLANLAALRLLDLSYNQISSLSPLANLAALKYLYFGNNQVSDLSPLAGLPSLIQIAALNNQISDLTSLANLTTLTYLHLYGNQISDLTPLANLTALTYLSLYSNQVSDLQPLRSLTALTTLSLGDNLLDLTSGSEDMEVIDEFLARGVNVTY